MLEKQVCDLYTKAENIELNINNISSSFENSQNLKLTPSPKFAGSSNCIGELKQSLKITKINFDQVVQNYEESVNNLNKFAKEYIPIGTSNYKVLEEDNELLKTKLEDLINYIESNKASLLQPTKSQSIDIFNILKSILRKENITFNDNWSEIDICSLIEEHIRLIKEELTNLVESVNSLIFNETESYITDTEILLQKIDELKKNILPTNLVNEGKQLQTKYNQSLLTIEALESRIKALNSNLTVHSSLISKILSSWGNKGLKELVSKYFVLNDDLLHLSQEEETDKGNSKKIQLKRSEMKNIEKHIESCFKFESNSRDEIVQNMQKEVKDIKQNLNLIQKAYFSDEPYHSKGNSEDVEVLCYKDYQDDKFSKTASKAKLYKNSKI